MVSPSQTFRWLAFLLLGVAAGCSLPVETPPTARAETVRASAGLLLAPAWSHDAPLPPDSVYRLDFPLRTADGSIAGLDLYRGHPVLVTGIPDGCPRSCAALVGNLRAIEAHLGPAAQADLRVLLFVLDDGPTPTDLADLPRDLHLDPHRWTVAHTTSAHLGELGAVLGLRLRPDPGRAADVGGVFAVLDRNGRLVERIDSVAPDASERVGALWQPRGSPDR